MIVNINAEITSNIQDYLNFEVANTSFNSKMDINENILNRIAVSLL